MCIESMIGFGIQCNTEGLQIDKGPFSPWAWKYNNSINSNAKKKIFRVKPKATNSSCLNLGSFPTQGDEFLVPV